MDAELREVADGESRGPAVEHARKLRGQRDGAEGRRVFFLARLQIPVQPAVGRALHAGRRRLHVVLRVEMRPRAVGRSARVHDGEIARAKQRRERRQPRVEAEEAVEVDGRVAAAGRPRNRDRRPRLVVIGLAVRHDDAQAVDGSALEDGDEPLRANGSSLREGRAREERRREAEADEREGAVLEEDATGGHRHAPCDESITTEPRRHRKRRRSTRRSTRSACPAGRASRRARRRHEPPSVGLFAVRGRRRVRLGPPLRGARRSLSPWSTSVPL